jgi:hypothetical protein
MELKKVWLGFGCWERDQRSLSVANWMREHSKVYFFLVFFFCLNYTFCPIVLCNYTITCDKLKEKIKSNINKDIFTQTKKYFFFLFPYRYFSTISHVKRLISFSMKYLDRLFIVEFKPNMRNKAWINFVEKNKNLI